MAASSWSEKEISRLSNMSRINLPILIILATSVLMVNTEASPIVREEEPLTLIAGENGIIPFACRKDQQSASTYMVYYTFMFEEKDRPFYIAGAFDPEGLMSPDQAERFRVAYFEEGSSMSIEINITSVSVEDQGTYILLLIFHGETPEYRLMRRVVLILIPPGPAFCFLMPSEIVRAYEVHCHSRPGNGDSTLTCFQDDEKIPYLKDNVNTLTAYKRTFLLWKPDIPVSCCSHDIKEIQTITQTSCNQFRYPPIEPANSPVPPDNGISTKMKLTTRPLSGKEDNKKKSSHVIYVYSGSSRNLNWPILMLPIMALIMFACIINPKFKFYSTFKGK